MKTNLESINDVIVDLAIEILKLKSENEALKTLLIKNEVIDNEELNSLKSNIQEEIKIPFVAEILKTTVEEVEIEFNK